MNFIVVCPDQAMADELSANVNQDLTGSISNTRTNTIIFEGNVYRFVGIDSRYSQLLESHKLITSYEFMDHFGIRS